MTAQRLSDTPHYKARDRHETWDPDQVKFAAPNNAGSIKTAVGNGRVFMVHWSTSPGCLDSHIEILCIDSRGAWDKNSVTMDGASSKTLAVAIPAWANRQ